MPIRLSGINSGLDTDALVKELVSAYSLKTEKYEKQKTKLEWKKESWQGMNTKIYGLYTNISNLRYDSAYALKKTNVSDATKASVKASATAASGTQKLSVLSTAQACYITGGKLRDDITGSTKLKELGVTGKEVSLTIKRDSGEDETITISEDDTVSGLMKKLQDCDLNANFDENNNRVYISAKESGEDGNFSLESTDIGVKTLISSLGLGNADPAVIQNIKDKAVAYKNDVTSAPDIYTVTRNAEGNITAVEENSNKVKEYQEIVTKYEALENATARYEAREAFEKVVGAAGEKFTEQELMTALNEGKDIEEFFEEKGFDSANTEITSAIEELSNYSVKESGKIDGSLEELGKVKSDAETALNDLNLTDVNAAYTNAKSAVELKAKVDAYGANVKDVALGVKTAEAVLSSGGAVTRIDGTDAIIRLNNVEYTSNSNSFNINGLTIEAYAKTITGEYNPTEGYDKIKDNDNPITITTATDNQGIYDKIKDFLTEYNNVINEITKSYNADSAGDYEPLTDEEKDAMSDTEVEKWEKKIKDSLLRRDTSLGVVMNAMTNTMAQTITIDGEKLSLSNFGISTLGFLNSAKNEQYAYHIDGDEDDSATSGKEDKLMAAIQNDPDRVIKFMKELTTNLHKVIDDKMKSTELSSAYKVYNDKEMDNELKDIEEVIKKWKDKVADEEDRYYKQFSNMEVALSKLQSQTNALAGLLGQ